MTVAVQGQSTGAPALGTGPLTVPLQIITDAGARHRVAVAEHEAFPAWAIIGSIAAAAVFIVFAVFAWRPVGSPLLIGCSLMMVAAVVTPDVVAAIRRRTAGAE
jgi:hypothetical protein